MGIFIGSSNHQLQLINVCICFHCTYCTYSDQDDMPVRTPSADMGV